MLVSFDTILISREVIKSGEKSDVCRIGCRSILDSVIGKRRGGGRERETLMDALRTRELANFIFLFPSRGNI